MKFINGALKIFLLLSNDISDINTNQLNKGILSLIENTKIIILFY